MKIAQVRKLLPKMTIRERHHSQIIPFVPNFAQNKILDQLQKLEEEGKPQWIIVLKARQVGISTLTEALLLLHCISTPNARALILAHDHRSSLSIFGYAKQMLKSLPLATPPPNQTLIRIPHSEGTSEFSTSTAGNASSGRGMSLSAIHFSEASSYKNARELFAALTPAIPYTPGTIVVIESTAKGQSGEGELFYKQWKDAEQGSSQFTPIFIPWTDNPDYQRSELEAKDAPIDDVEKDLMKQGVTRRQIAWRRHALETECHGDPQVLSQEYPYTPDESFLSSGNPAFRREEIQNVVKTKCKPKLIGSFFDSGSTIDALGRSVPIMDFEAKPDGKFRLWEEPKRGDYYYIGADPARGQGESEDRFAGDYAAMVIWNGTTGDQAAEYMDRIPPRHLAHLLNSIGRYYNTALINIELTGNLGIETQRTLVDAYYYPNIYRWKGPRDDSALSGKRGHTFGWETQYRSRQMAMVRFRESIRIGEAIVKSERLFSQMQAVTDEFGDRWEMDDHEDHDDLFMAALIGWVARVQYPPPNVQFVGGQLDHADLSQNKIGKTSYMSTGFTAMEMVTQNAQAHWAEIVRGNNRNMNRVRSVR